MTKQEALSIIDNHKNKLTTPVDLLWWTWFRGIIRQIPEEDWDKYVELAAEVMMK